MKKYSQKFYTILVTSIILFALVNVFVSYPLIKDILRNKNILAEKEKELNSISEERNTDVKLYQSRNKIQDLYNKIFSYLPNDANESDFVIQASEIAKLSDQNQTDIAINRSTNSSQSASGQSAKLVKTSFSLTEEGTFPGLLTFMDKFEKMNRMFSIESFNITLNENNNLVTKIDGTIYSKNSSITSGSISDITQSETNTINNLEHFGEQISADSNPSLRADPFSLPQ